MNRQELIRPMTQIGVSLSLERGHETYVMNGYVFAEEGSRVLNVLNDREPFIAFEHSDGAVELINKKKIISVTPKDIKGRVVPEHLQT